MTGLRVTTSRRSRDAISHVHALIRSDLPAAYALGNEYQHQRADHHQYRQRDHDRQPVGEAQLAEQIDWKGRLGARQQGKEFMISNNNTI
jgi:hypothetical protein